MQKALNVTGMSASNIGAAYALAAIPARVALERGMWKEAAQVELRTSMFPQADGCHTLREPSAPPAPATPPAPKKRCRELERIVAGLKAAKNDYWATEVEVQRLSAAAWTAYAKGAHDEALTLMRSAADLEDKSEKHAVTPGRLVPARELLGEMLLEMKRPADALKEFETSGKQDPNRFRGLYGAGKAAALAGDQAKARTYYEKLLALAKNADTERPELKDAKMFLAQK